MKTAFISNVAASVLVLLVSMVSHPAHAQVPYAVDLKKGENFVSFPVALEDSTIVGLFGPVLANVESIEYFDALKGWLTYLPGFVGEQELYALPSGAAFVVRMKTDARLEIIGGHTSGLNLPPIRSGWNAIGVANTASPRGLSSTQGVMSLESDAIYGVVNGTASRFYADNQLVAGAGYWLWKALPPDGQGEGAAGAGGAGIIMPTAEEMSAYKTACGSEYNPLPSKPIVQATAKCKTKNDNLNVIKNSAANFEELSPDIALGGFTITDVRVHRNSVGKKVGGIGILTEDNMDASAKPLMGIVNGSTVVSLDFVDNVPKRAIAEDMQGLRVGTRTFRKIEYLDISENGSVEATVTGEIDDLGERSFFVSWEPCKVDSKDEIENPECKNIKLGLPLADVSVAYAIWDIGVSGQLVRRAEGGDAKWFITPPATAKGMFEPQFSRMINGTSYIVNASADSSEGWIPASASQMLDSDTGLLKVSFSAEGIKGLAILTSLHAGVIPPETIYDTITVDESGIFVADKGDKGYRFEGGRLFIRALWGKVQFIAKGWSLLPSSFGKNIKNPTLYWTPTFALRLPVDEWAGSADNPNSVLEAGFVEIAVEPRLALELFKTVGGATPASGFKEMLAQLRRGGAKIDSFTLSGIGDFTFDLGGADFKVVAGAQMKSDSLGGNNKRYGLGYALDLDLSLESPVEGASLKVALVVEEAWNTNTTGFFGPEASRQNYEAKVKLRGEGTLQIPPDWPFVGGQTLNAVYQSNLESVGGRMFNNAYARDYRGDSTLIVNLAQGEKELGNTGWKVSFDEIKIKTADKFIYNAATPTPLVALGKYLNPANRAPLKSFLMQVTVTPDEAFTNTCGAQGPFVGTLMAERKSDFKTGKDYTDVMLNMDLRSRWYFMKKGVNGQDEINPDQYVELSSVTLQYNNSNAGIANSNAHVTISGAGVYRSGAQTIGISLLYDRGENLWLAMVEGANLTNELKNVNAMLTIQKRYPNKPPVVTAALGARLSGEAFATAMNNAFASLGLGVGKDKVPVDADILFNGTFSNDGGTSFSVELNNIPLTFIQLPEGFELDSIRTLSFSKQADGTFELTGSLGMIFTQIIDTDKPHDQWTRTVAGVTIGSEGWTIVAQNIAFERTWFCEDSKFNFQNVELGKSKTQGIWKVNTTVVVGMCESFRDWAKAAVALPKEISLTGELNSRGFLLASKWDPAPKITLAGGMEISMNEFVISKQSPLKFGIKSQLTKDGKTFDGTIGVGPQGLSFSLPDDVAVPIPMPAGFGAEVRGLNAVIGPQVTLGGIANVTIPEGNPMRNVFGERFQATIMGSPTAFTFSTATSVSLEMDMGPAGNANLLINAVSLSSDGAFAGSGSFTLSGQKTSLVISTQGGNVSFLADFGEKGIDMELAKVFMLKIQHTIGIKTVMGFQMLQIDDLDMALGDDINGIEAATDRFFYFLPSSIPPAGFAFFDNLEGKVHVVGFTVSVGMNFPAPNQDDLKVLVDTFTPAMSGGDIDWTKLGELSAPAFGLHDVYMQFPVVEGYAWNQSTNSMAHTDNMFGSIFGRDRLVFVDRFMLKPKNFVELATAGGPLEVIKMVIPADKRKGSASINLSGFQAGASYDLREDETIYESTALDKLPDIYPFVRKALYVHGETSELPSDIGSGTTKKSVDIPSVIGGGSANVSWSVSDLSSEIASLKALIADMTPPAQMNVDGHLQHVIDKMKQRGTLEYTANKLSTLYDRKTNMTVSLELDEYENSFDVSGIYIYRSVIYLRLGTATLYANEDFGGASLPIGREVGNLGRTPLGDNKASSVKIEGRGKVKLFADTGYKGVMSELSADTSKLSGTDVGDNAVSSVDPHYSMDASLMTKWRLRATTPSGVVMTMESGAIEITMPGDVRVLTLLNNTRAQKIRELAVAALSDELMPSPRLFNSHQNYLSTTWSRIAGYGLPASATGLTLNFKRQDGYAYGFSLINDISGNSFSGVKFDERMKSLLVRRGSVMIFESVNYAGTSFELTDDLADLASSPLGRDKASSVKVEGGGIVTLYSESAYGTRSESIPTTMTPKVNSGYCASVSGSSTSIDAQVNLWSCKGADSQKLRILPVGDGYYNLTFAHSDMCLTVYANNNDNEQKIIQFTCGSQGNRKWKLKDAGGGYYNIVAGHSNKCLNLHYNDARDGGIVNQYDCNNHDSQRWKVSTTEKSYQPSTFRDSKGWLGDFSIGNDKARSAKVFDAVNYSDVSEWSISRSLPYGAMVYVGARKEDGGTKPYISVKLIEQYLQMKAYYDDGQNLETKYISTSGFEYPDSGYRAFVEGREVPVSGLDDLLTYTRTYSRTASISGTTVTFNEQGGFSAIYKGVAISPESSGSKVSVFTLSDRNGVSYRFSVSQTGGFGSAMQLGAKDMPIPVYRNSANVPAGVRRAVGMVPGGFFVDANLNAGSRNTVNLAIMVSGAIKTDGSYYFKGNGNLVIANFEVSEAVVSVSSDEGLYIRGKMDMFTLSKVDIEGYLSPNGEFSFTGVAEIMVSGTGVRGALAVNNSGLNVVGTIYIANTRIKQSTFKIADGRVSFSDSVGVGFAGVDMTTSILFVSPYGAGFTARGYLDVDVPVRIWGATKWDCASAWGVKVCWPSQWDWITVGSVSTHFSQSFSGGMEGSVVSLGLGPAKLNVDVAKPALTVKW